MIAGLILAGGKSSRFGREKAGAPLYGTPMIEHVRQVLMAGTDAVAVSAKPGSSAAAFAAAHQLPCLPDPEGAAAGPLAGVLEGLRWAIQIGASALVTAPCDTPFLPNDLAARLSRGNGAAVAVTAEGMQPLVALWPVTAADLLAQTLAAGHPAAHRMLRDLGAQEVFFEEAWLFSNINTLEDYAAASAPSSRPPPTREGGG